MTVEVTLDHEPHLTGVVELFERTFTASEGSEEGRAIGTLVRDLLTKTPASALMAPLSFDGDTLVGATIYTPLTFEQDDRRVMLLLPVAVAPTHQRRGIGQDLILRGLDILRERGIDVAVTDGDPGFYGKVGFVPVSETVLPAPLPLSQPEGWLAQSLTGGAIARFRPPSRCALALDATTYW